MEEVVASKFAVAFIVSICAPCFSALGFCAFSWFFVLMWSIYFCDFGNRFGAISVRHFVWTHSLVFRSLWFQFEDDWYYSLHSARLIIRRVRACERGFVSIRPWTLILFQSIVNKRAQPNEWRQKYLISDHSIKFTVIWLICNDFPHICTSLQICLISSSFLFPLKAYSLSLTVTWHCFDALQCKGNKYHPIKYSFSTFHRAIFYVFFARLFGKIIERIFGRTLGNNFTFDFVCANHEMCNNRKWWRWFDRRKWDEVFANARAAGDDTF